MSFTVTAGGATTGSITATSGTGDLEDLFRDAAYYWTTGATNAGALVAGVEADGTTPNGIDYYCISAHTSGASTRPTSGADWATVWVAAGAAGSGPAGARRAGRTWATSTAYNAAPIWKTGSNPYTYTVKSIAAAGRQVQLAAGVTLYVNNPGDTWEWHNVGNVSGTYVLYVQAGSTLYVTGDETAGITIDFDKDFVNNRTATVLWYGNSYLTGQLGKEIILKHYNYMTISDLALNGSTMEWNYVKLLDTLTGYVTMNAENNSKSRIFNYITHDCENTPSGGVAKRGHFRFAGDFNSSTFDHWTINNTTYTMLPFNAGMKFSNGSFTNGSLAFGVASSGLACARRNYTFSTNNYMPEAISQPLFVFDTCYFDNNDNGAHFFNATYNAAVLLRNCTFGTTAVTRGLYAYYGAMLLIDATTNTNLNASNAVTKKLFGAGGKYLHVRTLSLTVQDENGNPVQNAVVLVMQKELKEHWSFATNASGQIKTIHGDDPVFVEKEETTLNVFTQWSDGTGDRIHRIVIAKSGYQTWTRDVAFTADRVIVAKLQPESNYLSMPVQF